MTRTGRAVLMLAIGAVTGRLLWSGGFGWFVQQRMRIPLILATVVLLAFGIYEVIGASIEERRHPESSERSISPAVGWLMLLPLLVLFSVAPTGLGAAAADRVDAYTPTESTRSFEPLDTSAGPPEMRVYDFLNRAIWDPEMSLADTPVRLEGLVVNDASAPGGFKLTRFLVSCCAADGIPIQVTVHGSEPLEDDTWVVADVVWRPPPVPYDGMEEVTVEADLVSLTVIPDAPKDAYESPY